ncbi:cysteine desulfurase family protein [Nitratifractor sp.]
MQVYLDNNRLTQVDPQVLGAMEPFLKEPYGDLHALHARGASSRKEFLKALEKLYAGLHAPEESDIFFSSGTAENHSTLLMGIYSSLILTGRKNNLIISERSDAAMMEGAGFLESQGCKVHKLPVNEEGIVDPESLYDYLTPRTALVSVPMVDPESGAINPVEEITEICRRYEVPFHTDATHALGKIPIDVQSFDPDLLSFGGEAIHAPAGIGAVYLKDSFEWMPTIFGARNPWERYRGGPLNLAGAVGLGKAIELASDALEFEMEDTRDLRDRLEEELRTLPGVTPLVAWALRVPNTVLFTVEGLESELMLYELDRGGVEAYACTVQPFGNWQRHPITDALGLDPRLKHSTVGFALSRFTTEEEIDHTIKTFKEMLEYLRSFSTFKEVSYEQK